MEKNFTFSINYKSIILGGVAKFSLIDVVDLHLIIEEFTNKTGIIVYGDSLIGEFDKFVDIRRDGTITLKEGYELDTILEEAGLSIREKLLNGIDPRVKDFFDDLDVRKYYEKKERFLQTELVLNEANVLLISDEIEDYEGLKKLGFKNIDYFKSIIRADTYFENNPAKLESYHLILIGNQSVQNCCFFSRVNLENRLEILKLKTSGVQVYIRKNRGLIETYLTDRTNKRSYLISESNIEKFYKKVIENMLINKILEDLPHNHEVFTPYIDYINPKRFIPREKEDLKILFLDIFYIREISLLVIKNLGLNIHFRDDNNFSLGEFVKSHLGDYDIIIASSLFSFNLLGMNKESTEQCKDTGRELTLLLTYDELKSDKLLGSVLNISYTYGGNLTPGYNIVSKEVGVVSGKISNIPELSSSSYNLRKYFNIKAIIESAVSLYNEALNKKRIAKVKKTKFKNLDEINEEYMYALVTSEEQQRREMEPIRIFDNIRITILNYLRFRNAKYTKKTPKDIRIKDVKGGVKIENIINGVVVCSLTFKREYKENGLRIFIMETPTKKGTLSSPEIVGLYISLYDGKEDVPKRPNIVQANALSAIEKKIAFAVKPINDEVWSKLNEKEKQKIRKLTNPLTLD